MIRRLGRHSPATVVDELGAQSVIPAIWVNSDKTGEIRKVGKGSGGRDFKASAKRLRVLSEQVEGINPEWRVTVGGEEYFPADHDHQDGGSTLLYLAPLSEPTDNEGEGNGWC
ncbi:MAG: head-tail joining protein [Aeromonas sobria]